MTGESITGVTGMIETFVDERPVSISHSGLSGEAGTERGPVTVDDAALFLARFSGGAIATFEATRFAWGRKNAIRIEINGTKGSLAFDFEDMNVLGFSDAAMISKLPVSGASSLPKMFTPMLRPGGRRGTVWVMSTVLCIRLQTLSKTSRMIANRCPHSPTASPFSASWPRLRLQAMPARCGPTFPKHKGVKFLGTTKFVIHGLMG